MESMTSWQQKKAGKQLAGGGYGSQAADGKR